MRRRGQCTPFGTRRRCGGGQLGETTPLGAEAITMSRAGRARVGPAEQSDWRARAGRNFRSDYARRGLGYDGVVKDSVHFVGLRCLCRAYVRVWPARDTARPRGTIWPATCPCSLLRLHTHASELRRSGSDDGDTILPRHSVLRVLSCTSAHKTKRDRHASSDIFILHTAL